MNEMIKTLSFVGVAALALVVGVWTHRPPADEDESRSFVGEPLFKDFKDPRDAKSLEIVEYDEDTAELQNFKVAQVKGVWVIPSHEDYPADASQQLGEAAASIIEAKTVNIESDDPETHETYGVVDPDPKKLTVGASGVGKLVTMENKAGKKLAQLIIGKQADKAKPDLRYVRKPNQNRVYVASIKTDKLSTKFEDWIEKDLLKLNAWDVQEVAIKDYSIVEELGGRASLSPRANMQLVFDSKESKWKVLDLEVFKEEPEGFQSEPLADDEELNTQKLNELKTALDDLKIIDVRRKPAGLSADLRAGESLLDNEEAMESLIQRGFRVARVRDGQSQGELGIYSNEGEIHCGTKEGVEYILRFGRITQAGGKEKDEPAADAAEGELGSESDADGKGTGANRFIMVTAQFNEDLLAKPELEPLPGESPAADADSAEGQAGEAKKTSSIESSLADAEGLLAQAGGKSAGKENAQPKTEAQPKAGAAKVDDKAKTADAAKGDAKPQADEDKTDAEKSSDDKPSAKPKTDLETERIKKENERKQKEYDDKVKKGEEKVKELSDRFADWYYVISDKTYQKIHLTRDDIVKKKASAETKASDDISTDKDHSLPE